MKILAFSDLHRDTLAAHQIVDAAKDADVVVGAGDFAIKGKGTTETLEVLRSCLVPVVIVPGNHDNIVELETFCKGWKNSHFLHGNGATISGIHFFGLGGEVPRRNEFDWNIWLSEEATATKLAHCPEGAVLVTHNPPWGVCDLQSDGTHEGSKSVLATIRDKNPALCLCGHIHHSWGASANEGFTTVRNLGPTVNWFELPG